MATRPRSTRRASMVPNQPTLIPTRTSSRRVSSATALTAPSLKKPLKARKNDFGVGVANAAVKKLSEPGESFVAGDMFDFSGMEMESPKGPMTRSRRTSMFVGAGNLNKGLPMITSTARKSALKNKSRLNAVVETPEASFVQAKPAKAPKKDSPAIKESQVVISPIKKAILSKAFATNTVVVKKKEITPRPTAKSSNLFPGTPQPTDPANVLKRNLKLKVAKEMDEKIQEIPKNSSPYTLLVGETENGSPVEHFVKMESKPTVQNVTGTPATKRPSSRILQRLNSNVNGSPAFPGAPRRRSTATPKKILNSMPKTENEQEPMQIETENVAVNKALAKAPTSPKMNTQMITGDLANMCVVM